MIKNEAKKSLLGGLKEWLLKRKEIRNGERTFKFRFGGSTYPSTVTVDKNDIMIRLTDHYPDGSVKRFSRYINSRKILEINYTQRTGKIKSIYIDNKGERIEFEFGSDGEFLSYISPKSKIRYNPEGLNKLLYQIRWEPQNADFRLIAY